MIQYILECIAFQLVFLAIYDFFLKRETFFQWNRVYLIGTYTVSLILPWIKIEAFKAVFPDLFNNYPEFLWGMEDAGGVLGSASGSVSHEFPAELVVLYSGMFLAALLFGYKLLTLYRLKEQGQLFYFTNYTKVVVSDSLLAFSFFRSIFLGDKIDTKNHENIIQHELVHIEQRHTLDLLYFEVMRILGWFNPLVYVYQSRISEVHEFIADAKVVKTQKQEHFQLLLSQVFQSQNISFINQFFKSSLIKKRIVMLKKAQSKKIWKLKYLFLIPMITAMLFYTSCQDEAPGENFDPIRVADIENLTSAEEAKIFGRLRELSGGAGDWQLYVKDNNSTMKFVRSDDGSFITGPKNEKIAARLAIDSKLTSGLKDIADQLQSKGASLNPNLKYNQLLAERNRLLQNTGEESPIIQNLDHQLFGIKQQIIEMNEGAVPFGWVDEVPIFPGCENAVDKRACFQEAMQTHIRKHFNYPKEAIEKGIQGRVNLMFTITENGTINNLKLRGPDKLLEDEASRIIEKLPNMKPGIYDGKVVRVPFSIPITFRLN